jgi:hypothetical protein
VRCFDLAQHGVEGVDQVGRLVLADAARPARIVAPLDHFARDAGDGVDRRGDRVAEAAHHQPGGEQRQQGHRGADQEVVAQAFEQVVLRAQIDGAELLAFFADGLVQHQVVAVADIAILARLRRERQFLARRHVPGEQLVVFVVQRGGAHRRAGAQQRQVLARQAGIVERQRGRGHVPDQLGLGRQVVAQIAAVAAQIVGDHDPDRHHQRGERGPHHDRDEFLANRAARVHGCATGMRARGAAPSE